MWSSNLWALRRACYLVLVCGIATIVGTIALASDPLSASPDGYERSIQTLEETISLLKWLGGTVISALVAGIGLLYRALETANATMRRDLMEGMEKRATLMTSALEVQIKLATRIEELADKMEAVVNEMGKGCPYASTLSVERKA
jgi:hypothetical protein